MKVIFLDVDGVLNNDNTSIRTKQGCLFVDNARIELLKQIVDATDARIVLSSTWRYDRNDSLHNGDFLELKEALAAHGLEFYSYTPVDAIGIRRGMEIKAWLGSHPEVKRFVILDDELFDFEERKLMDRVILTAGLTQDHVRTAIEMLNEGENWWECQCCGMKYPEEVSNEFEACPNCGLELGELEPKIRRNRARCRKCGAILESRSRHDLQTCSCGAVQIDGGLDYLRRFAVNLDDIEDLSEVVT